MKLLDRACGHLNRAVACLALLQGLDVLAGKREIFQVRQLRRIAEFADGEIPRKLAEAVEIARKVQIVFRFCFDVNRTEHEDLVRGARLQSLGNRFSVADGCNLIVVQPDVLLEVSPQVRIGLRKRERSDSGNQDEQNSNLQACATSAPLLHFPES